MAHRIVVPQLWRPRPDALREGYLWHGDLEDIPVEWRADPHLDVMPNGDLRVLTSHGYARARPTGDAIARNLANALYPCPSAEWHAGYELATHTQDVR